MKFKNKLNKSTIQSLLFKVFDQKFYFVHSSVVNNNEACRDKIET